VKFLAALVMCLLSLWIVGCGGGGGGLQGGSLVQASFSIQWPARTRAIVGPLSSSLSAVVVFPKAGSKGSDVSITVDRNTANFAAYTGTYPLPQKVLTKAVKSLSATFYSDADGQGTVVGSATAVASLNGSNIQFSQIVVSGTIKHVTAIASSIQLGAGPTQLTFSATDASGNVVAVTPGSATWSLVSGNSALTLTPAGMATPVQTGQAQVAVTVDGIVSAPATITVGAGSVSNATFQITWPARSGASLTHNLSSALSVLVNFKAGKVGGGDLTVPVDRDSNQIAAYTATYSIDQPIESSCNSMTATFYSSAGEQGVAVGTATGQVTVGSPSVNLGSIVVNGVVKSVTVMPAGNIVVGASGTQLQFSATDATNAAVAVTPGSAIWSVTSGQANLTLTGGGIATGTKVGQAIVTATVDGISSPPATIQIVTSPTTNVFGIDANDIAFDPNSNTLYVCATASSRIGPSQVVPINLTTNTVGTPFAAGTAPTNICITSDGSELFSANASGIFCRVPTSTRIVDLVFNAPQGLVPTQLLTLPNAPSSFVAMLTQPGSADFPTRVCAVYDAGTMRANAPNLGIRAAIDPSGTQVFGVDNWSSPNSYFWGSITGSGVTNVNGGFSLELGADVDICYQNGVLALGGYVQLQFVNASDGSVLASTGEDAWYRYVAPSVGTNNIYLLSWSVLNNNTVIIQPYDVTSFGPTSGAITITGFGGSPAKMIAAGPHRVAFLATGNGSTDSVVVESGLP